MQICSRLISKGKLVTAGPFIDGSSALFIYEVATLQDEETRVSDDLYLTGGATIELLPESAYSKEADEFVQA
jgi:uncharacterized protein YciI